MVKVYVTSHAISRGIEEFEGAINGGVFVYSERNGGGYSRFAVIKEGDFFLKREDALVRANELKPRRLESLVEQIRRLESLSFE